MNNKMSMLSFALVIADEDVSYDLTIRGLSRERYDQLPGDQESVGPCDNPDCSCTVWMKFIDFGEDGVLTLNTSEAVTLESLTKENA